MASTRASLWEGGYDESVEVNQRALIDKVLARYSGEFTVFRELLQNSDDAGSKSVEIHFETQAFLHRRKEATSSEDGALSAVSDKIPDLRKELVHQWSFKNNGMVFRDEDWNRLKKIAEGNPDEEKIGAFGVGFYSLFSITEEPFVTSGDQWMGFYWKDKKDQLFARRGTLPPETSTSIPSQREWTTFEMPLREPAPIPLAFDFARFLASSITFMVHLREVSMYFDGKLLARLGKDPGASKSLSIPKGLKSSSPMQMMYVKGIRTTPLHIKAEIACCVYMSGTAKPAPLSQSTSQSKLPPSQSGFFASLFSSLSGAAAAPTRTPTPLPPQPVEEVDPLSITESNVVLSIFSAEVDVKLDKKMVLELQRSTKKNPPTSLKVDLIYTGKSEYDASKDEDKRNAWSTGSIFQGLRADLDGTGSARVFIGHATGQTTGIGGHLAARFIPTVERESIDLVDRNVSMWNKELLYVGGFLARAAYEIEMSNIRDLWLAAVEPSHKGGMKTVPDEELQRWLRDRCLHALKFFTFHASTPSSLVSNLLEAGFFSSALSHTFSIMSSAGVQSAADVRIPDASFSSFLKQLPVLPEDIMTGASTMIEALRTRNLIKEITFIDVLNELRARPLNETELIACMKWWIDLQGQGSTHGYTNLNQIRQELINAAVLTIDIGTPKEKILPLSSLRTFVNLRTTGSVIPLDGPIPDHTLPMSVSRTLRPDNIVSAFGWDELTVVDWLRHITSPQVRKTDVEFDFTSSPIWAERVLNVLARAWPSLSKPDQTQIVNLLKNEACVPTRAGLRLPAEAYFQNANIFPDLPVLAMPKGSVVRGNLEKVFQALGVRKHVELQLVFNRMIKTGDWTIVELIKYFVAVQQTLTPIEMDKLKNTAVFPREMPSDAPAEQRTKYNSSDLYEPLDVFRELKLPVIDWGTQIRWRASSEEAKFLYLLGLRRLPPLNDIMTLAASSDEKIRNVALKYFLDNQTKYSDYDAKKFVHFAFIPAVTPDGKSVMGTPDRVFVDPECAVLGFNIVNPSIKDVALTKIGLERQPPTSMIMPLLSSSALRTPETAKQWFEVLAGRIADFTQTQLGQLSQMKIIPATPPTSSVNKEKTPTIEMRAPKECYFKRDSEQNFHSKLFVFVDFGTKANNFLSACGVKHEPSVEEIVQILLADPRKFYDLAGARENYLTELRNIAINHRSITTWTRTRMKRAAILLGSKRVKKTKEANATASQTPNSAGADLDEEEWDLQYDLLRGDQVVIADDTNAYQFFGDAVFSAPQEDMLEAFYSDLGSPRLSSLVHEDHKVSMEIKDSKVGREIRALILERLPLFLHEHTHARTRVPYSWINNEKNFVIRTFGKLAVTKHLNFAGMKLAKSQDASAAGKRQGGGPIELWLAGNAQVDMYEVAISLCRLLFEAPKVNDALLFMTILSTDLRALRRRGYNVDRILKKQKAEREAAEESRRAEAKEMERLISDPYYHTQQPQPEKTPAALPPVQKPSTVSAPIPIPAAKRIADSENHRPISPELGSDTETLTGKDKESRLGQGAGAGAAGLMGSLQNWRKKLRNTAASPVLPPMDEGGTQVAGPSGGYGFNEEEQQPPPYPQQPQQPQPQQQGGVVQNRPSTPKPPKKGVTPLSDINANINQAIQACREERGHLLQNRQEMRTVRESAEDGYCDVSGRVGNLTYIGSMSDVKIYVTPDVASRQTVLTTKRTMIARFIHVVQALRGVYRLPAESLHIFMDSEGGTIAFNRAGSLFLNLRYYESWHDAGVYAGDMSKALTSWYFTLAHEIAHNLVQQHDSEHEFWFSSICEAHTPALMKMIVQMRSEEA